MMSSLDAKETLESKLAFGRLILSFGVKIKKYRVENGRFNDPLYKDSCEKNNQTLTFCGVGAHHQNGIAKRSIQDLELIGRTVIPHGIIMWPETISVSLCPYALKYASDRHNHLTLDKHDYTPLERISRTQSQIAPEYFTHGFDPGTC